MNRLVFVALVLLAAIFAVWSLVNVLIDALVMVR